MTESSDETTPLDDAPATDAVAPAEDADVSTPDDVIAETEPEPETAQEPEPEREPVVVSGTDLPAAIAAVRDAIKAGESVVFPTDTVYGIAADPFSPQAVQGLLDAKHRGRDMPPPVLIGDPEVLDAYAKDVPAAARILAERHWPGPLTLILSAQSSLRMDLGETKGSIGVRVPDHDLARAILRATGPLAVSSANVSGEPPATDVDEAVTQLRGSVAVYVDGGSTPGPTPSTIVDFASGLAGKVVRIGAISLEELRADLPGLQGPEADPEPEPEVEPDPEPESEPSAEGTTEPAVAESTDEPTPAAP